MSNTFIYLFYHVSYDYPVYFTFRKSGSHNINKHIANFGWRLSCKIQSFSLHPPRFSMGNSYSSHQFGILNFNISSINFPSLMLGIIIVVGVWLVCRFRTSCKIFGRRHQHQAIALNSIARSLEGGSMQAATSGLPMITRASTIKTPDKNYFLDL